MSMRVTHRISMTCFSYVCQLHTYIDTRRDAVYASVHIGVEKSVKREDVSKRGKKEENWVERKH